MTSLPLLLLDGARGPETGPAPTSPDDAPTAEQWAQYETYAAARAAAGNPIPHEYDARLLAQSPWEHDRTLAVHYLRLVLRGPWRPPQARVNRRLVRRHEQKCSARQQSQERGEST